MHYHHSYHAGNFADVFKHALLVCLLQALSRKDKPWRYIDTHAGQGGYSLTSEAAGRTAEWQDGIGRLREKPHPALAGFMSILEKAGADAGRYPGSPAIARALARGQDRLTFCEMIPAVADILKLQFRNDAIVSIRAGDGFEAYSALPPPEKRCLMLIDPPFEAPDEFVRVAELLERALKRFAAGVYAVWYPVKSTHMAGVFTRRIGRESGRPVLNVSFDVGITGDGRLHRCGLLIVNPPFGFADEIRPLLAAMLERLKRGPRPAFDIDWIAHE
jgi:23S rRNA (adenine2030-N6)-methyltransferase